MLRCRCRLELRALLPQPAPLARELVRVPLLDRVGHDGRQLDLIRVRVRVRVRVKVRAKARARVKARVRVGLGLVRVRVRVRVTGAASSWPQGAQGAQGAEEPRRTAVRWSWA